MDHIITRATEEVQDKGVTKAIIIEVMKQNLRLLMRIRILLMGTSVYMETTTTGNLP